jgi:hypothetical protein
MRHDWIFDVLSDLKAYAQKNDLLALSAKVDEVILVARAEIAATGIAGAGAGSALGHDDTAPDDPEAGDAPPARKPRSH